MAYFGPFKCCSLRIFVFAIGILFLLVQTTFLIVTFVLMRDIETHVENWFNWMTSKGIPISNYWIIKVSLYIYLRPSNPVQNVRNYLEGSSRFEYLGM